ncbi:MAG: AAA family ATPase [Thermofilaceae archaeon]|nr:AAA family ATPase [Thermofilaceae archaeon]MDW8004474.1 ATPase domain-containing protein [Thermofilaceae archaeon]
MLKKSCDGCPYYLKKSNYCALLGKKVPNPSQPACNVQTSQGNNNSNPLPIVQPPQPVASDKPNLTFVQDGTLSQAVMLPPQQAAHITAIHPVASTQASGFQANVDEQMESQILEAGSFDFVRTGIEELDRALGGGFIRGKTYLVAGETGAGKTIFSIQFLLTGAYYYDEPGVYIAIDEPTEQLLKGLKRFGWDVASFIKEKKLTFLDMRTHFSKIYLREERKKIEPRFIIESIINAVKKTKAKRLVIDPIAPLIYGGSQEDVLYVREFLREMVFAIENLGTLTTIMTSEVPTGSRLLSRFGVEEFLASGIIVLGLEEVKGEVMRIMYLRKARWAPAKPVKFIFDIEPGAGIVIKGFYRDYS